MLNHWFSFNHNRFSIDTNVFAIFRGALLRKWDHYISLFLYISSELFCGGLAERFGRRIASILFQWYLRAIWRSGFGDVLLLFYFSGI